MLMDFIKDSVDFIDDGGDGDGGGFKIYNESNFKVFRREIIKSFSGKRNDFYESLFYLNLDESGVYPSLTMSAISRPMVKNMTELVELVNDTSVEFNKTNLSFHIEGGKPFIVLTASFFFFDDLESLLFKDSFGYSGYDKNSNESEEAKSKMVSIFRSMRIALLEASMSIDEKSINLMGKLISEE